MIQTISLLPGITLHVCRDTRFKQGCLSFQMVRRMDAGEASKNALLPAVLLRGTRRCPDLRAITARLDTLYGASVSPLVRRVGDYQTTGLYCGFMDDRFALPGDRVLGPMLAFLEELLLDSPLEDGGFLPAFVESEKKNLIATIESEGNDKRLYAVTRLLKAMCGGDSFGLPRLGERSQAAQIQAGELYAHYRRILAESPIEIRYVGSADCDRVARLLQPLLSVLKGRRPALPPQTPLAPGPQVHETEILDVTQGKLCLGYTTPITSRDPEFPAMQVLGTLFGGGMTSKLFVNVREKLSLCYSIGSSYYSSKGLMVVSAGIDFDKEALTRQEVARQLEACRQGQITATELDGAKQALLSGLRSVHDSPGSIESFYASANLSGMPLTPETYMDAVKAVTPEDVMAAAQRLTLHSTYFLKGGAQ